MRKETIKKMTVMAMLAALSMVLVYAIHVPLIPVVPFLEYDPADIPILIAAMAYGPVPAWSSPWWSASSRACSSVPPAPGAS